MSTHLPRCKKCKQSLDDQDLRVKRIHYNSIGNVEATFECGWCGHIWVRESPTLEAMHIKPRTPGYEDARKNATYAGTVISIIHR